MARIEGVWRVGRRADARRARCEWQTVSIPPVACGLASIHAIESVFTKALNRQYKYSQRIGRARAARRIYCRGIFSSCQRNRCKRKPRLRDCGRGFRVWGNRMCGDSGLGDPARMRHAKQRDAGSAAFQRSTWVSSCRMAMSAARRAVRLLRFARDGGAMQRRISNVIQLASPIAWCRRTGERHVRRTANEDRGRGGRGARGRRDGTHAGPRMPVLARRRHISVIGYRIRTTANRVQSKTGAEAPVLL